MTKIKLENEELDFLLEINVKDNWDEITLTDYINLHEVIEKREGLSDEEFLMNMLTILSDAKKEDLMDTPVGEFVKVTEAINIFSSLKVPEFNEDHLIIGDTIFVPKKNLSNLTTSEVIYIKTLQKNSENTLELYLGMLSILLRPGYKKEEGDKIRFIQHKLNEEDIDERKELFRNKLTSAIAIPLIKAFMSGTTK